MLVFNYISYSQENKPVPNVTDSLLIQRSQNIDSVKVIPNSTLDTIVKYQAKDSLIYDLKNKTLRLKNKAKLDFKVQKLSSDHIIFNFQNSTLEAVADSSKDPSKREYPQFSDGGQSFVGARIFYNFDTKQGIVNVGETEIIDGYFSGSQIKRINDEELFVQNGCYTNCDKPHPHYYFGSTEMKLKMNDKVYIDPIIFYVEDLPIAAIPIGLFFPVNKGRQSGLVLPNVFYSRNRGMTLENLGLYLALSDYYDTKFSLNFYTKGGFLLSDYTQWKLKNKFEGNADLKFGYTRYNPDDEYKQNYSIRLNHQQKFTPQMQLSANIDFMTEDFNRQTSNNIFDRSRQEITSYASFNQSFDNGISYSVNFNRSQNIITGTYNQMLPSVNFNIPTLYPLKNIISSNSAVSWLRDVTFTYSTNANFNQSKDLIINNLGDTNYRHRYSNKISHTPSLSISPKLGYFTINPYISFSANNYFRRSNKTFNQLDSTENIISENGFFTEYNYSLGANISTTLWGILKTNLGKLNSIRHQFKPIIGYSYTPDLSGQQYNFYGEYFNSKLNQNIRYSHFELDGGGIASQTLQNNLNLGFDNTFSITLNQDTGLPKKIDLLRLSLNTGYNFAIDSLNLRNINMNFSTPPIGNFNFNGSANFGVYDQFLDSNNRVVTSNKFLVNAGKGLATMNNLTLSVSTSFSSEGFFPTYGSLEQVDSLAFGDRFNQKMNPNESFYNGFGDNSPGYDSFSPPWSINLSLFFNYNKIGLNDYNKSLNLTTDFNFKITPTWNFTGRTGVDIFNWDFSNTAIIITKDLHCWSLYFEWYPIGVNKGFYLRFSPKAQNLKDLKIEKRHLPLYY